MVNPKVPTEADSRGGRPSRAEERDQAANQRDQAAGHRDHDGEQRDHDGEQRDHDGEQRDHDGEQRDHDGEQRDQAADQRDQAADRRDEAAEERDRAAERSEAAVGPWITTDARDRAVLARGEAASDRRRASHDRRSGASERTRADLDRCRALADRGSGASERTQAELDRGTALADRGASAREREHACVDDLTGVYLRGPGFVELDREVARARRARQPLVLAFVDVDHLKAVNDARGHAAGDRMLVEVAHVLRASLRAYDLIMRYGGDEFVCTISGLSMLEVTGRFARVNATLAAAPEHAAITSGLAELQPDDSTTELVARADGALYRTRQRQRYASGTIDEARGAG